MPGLLRVLTRPNPALHERANPVDADALARLRGAGFLDALIATMRAEDGVGIAATQVGAPHRIFVALEETTPVVYVNPEIVSQSTQAVVDTEGCLSVPGIIGTVRRARSVTLRAMDADGHPMERRARGLIARIYQHEIDHLNGILFIDRAVQCWEVQTDTTAPRV